MSPVINHLHSILPQVPVTGDIGGQLSALGPTFYAEVLPFQVLLSLEYSILCHQLRLDFLNLEHISRPQLIERLTAALLLCELLEHLHIHCLSVPREVHRLQKQKKIYIKLLKEIDDYSFPTQRLSPAKIPKLGVSAAQKIREVTVQVNWARILINRGMRVLNLLAVVMKGSPALHDLLKFISPFTNPFLAYFAWCFFVPRLTLNLFLLAKHSIPCSWWMDEEEQSINFWVRLWSQIKRRWFELANDSIWLSVGLLNCFLLIGPLAPFALYATVIAFSFDLLHASIRAYIELSTLYTLQKKYGKMLNSASNEEQIREICAFQNLILDRIRFEQIRFSIQIVNCTAVIVAMSLAIPLFALNPTIILASAIFLLLLLIVSFILTRKIDEYRPKDNFEVPTNLGKLGFFARKNSEAQELQPIPSTGSLLEQEEIEPMMFN